jgi:hypothetical protein
MWNNDFLDYVEIRRRIEQRLPQMPAVWAHLALFLGAVIVLVTVTSPHGGYYYYERVGYFIQPGNGFAMAGWSVLLLIHGLWAYKRSGAASIREQAVERELRERLEHDDTGLLADHRRNFRIRGLLDEDVRQRAGLYVGMLAFLLINAVTWLIWGANGARDSYTWQMTIPTAIAILAPAFALNAWRRARRDRKLQALMSEQHTQVAKSKRKLSFDEMAERAVRLSDDGELVVRSDRC